MSPGSRKGWMTWKYWNEKAERIPDLTIIEDEEEKLLLENTTQSKDMTAEFYDDPLGVHMIGAFYIPAKRMVEYVEAMGKLLCRIRKINSVEVFLYSCGGELADKMIVYR